MQLRRYFIMMLLFLTAALVTCGTVSSDISSSKIDRKVKTSDSVSSSTPMNSSPLKRDISLSYSATDVDSKEGARFKTITVIKNLNKDGTSEKLTINPALYKNERWADAFRDNFDSYGTIPDVPDIDDLFEFMNKKSKMKPKAKSENRPDMKSSPPQTQMATLNPQSPQTKSPSMPSMPPMSSASPRKSFMGRADEKEKPVVESGIETFDMEPATIMGRPTAHMKTSSSSMPSSSSSSSSMPSSSSSSTDVMVRADSKSNVQKSKPTVDKISGDAELIPVPEPANGQKRPSSKNNNSNDSKRPQSLLLMERLREPLINVNYSTPQHSVHQYFENYVQENSNGYNYQQPQPQPCVNFPSSTVTVTTPSGRTYDIPRTNSAANANNGLMNPYIAPSVVKKQPSQLLPTQSFPNVPVNLNPVQFPPYNQQQPSYSVNSIVPPLQNTPTQLPTAGPRPTTPNIQQQQPQYINNFSTSQRPYVAPNLRNGLGYNRGPAPTPIYNTVTGVPTYRPNLYGVNNKPFFGRSRGLKY